jgi:hypothetical protein
LFYLRQRLLDDCTISHGASDRCFAGRALGKSNSTGSSAIDAGLEPLINAGVFKNVSTIELDELVGILVLRYRHHCDSINFQWIARAAGTGTALAAQTNAAMSAFQALLTRLVARRAITRLRAELSAFLVITFPRAGLHALNAWFTTRETALGMDALVLAGALARFASSLGLATNTLASMRAH